MQSGVITNFGLIGSTQDLLILPQIGILKPIGLSSKEMMRHIREHMSMVDQVQKPPFRILFGGRIMLTNKQTEKLQRGWEGYREVGRSYISYSPYGGF